MDWREVGVDVITNGLVDVVVDVEVGVVVVVVKVEEGVKIEVDAEPPDVFVRLLSIGDNAYA